MGTSLIGSILLSFLALIPTTVWAQEVSDSIVTAEDLLADMSRALRARNYSGVFTYEHGGTLDAFRVTHSVDDRQQEYGQLDYLNGPERSVVRRGLGDECLTLAARLVGAEDQAFGLSRHYQFYLKGVQRVAGRKAQVVNLVPRDEYRHGYTLFIDDETSLPLLVMTVNNRRRVLERMQFSDLTIEDQNQPNQVSAIKTLTVAPDSGQSVVSKCDEPESRPLHWQLNWLPDGFVMTSHKNHETKGESLTFSDGLATFTVFVQPQSPQLTYQGTAQRGASLVMMLRVVLAEAPYLVTVVGEIPAVTAERVTANVGPRQIKLGSP
ncbi:MAG: sigma factor AlgU regulator MucB [Candidatus Pelagadaptatus aseana]